MYGQHGTPIQTKTLSLVAALSLRDVMTCTYFFYQPKKTSPLGVGVWDSCWSMWGAVRSLRPPNITRRKFKQLQMAENNQCWMFLWLLKSYKRIADSSYAIVFVFVQYCICSVEMKGIKWGEKRWEARRRDFEDFIHFWIPHIGLGGLYSPYTHAWKMSS